MMQEKLFSGLLLACVPIFLFSSACNNNVPTEPGNGSQENRSYALGFTDFPHANSSEAVAAAFAVIANDGDMAAMHFDGGVPWQEALDGAPYPQNVQAELSSKAGICDAC